ncbi:hypothetical protein [Escherichia phage SECphi4]|nr:hypothetical protein [Escherichia phage SECphi4]
MAAGTLSVTNNSKTVVGVGTTFTAFKAGDFLTLVVGQVPYTVAIASVESDTALTLVLPFDGPTAAGLAWDGVKRDTMSLATMGVTVQAQKALRLMLADENNWRAIFGDEEEITVTLPNGQVMQGMSWGYLSQLMKEIDPVEMRNLQQKTRESELATWHYRQEVEGFKNDTNSIKDQTNQIKEDTQAIHDATNAIKDQTNQIKADTGVIRDEANAANAEAQAASTAAQGFRDQAEELVQSINPDNLLTKSGNLAGLADRAASWLNIRPIGPTPLAGDPVDDYDATTKRWVQNTLNSGVIGQSWGVKNVNVSTPEPGVNVSGGMLVSEYSNPERSLFARLYSNTVWGYPGAAIIEAEGSNKHTYQFFEDGTVDFRKSGNSNRVSMHTSTSSWYNVTTASRTDLTSGGVDRILEAEASDILVLGYTIGASRPDGYPTKVGFHQYIWPTESYNFASAVISIGADNGWCKFLFGVDGVIWGSTDQGDFSYTRNGVSDSRVKHGIEPTTVDKAWSNLTSLQFVTFVYNNDEQERQRRGIIAQQAETVDKLYVKTRVYPGKNTGDSMVEQKELDTMPLLLDTMHVVQTLMLKIEAMEAEIATLREEVAELKK